MMRKWTAALLVLIVLAALPAAGFAVSDEAGGGAYAVLSSDGALYIYRSASRLAAIEAEIEDGADIALYKNIETQNYSLENLPPWYGQVSIYMIEEKVKPASIAGWFANADDACRDDGGSYQIEGFWNLDTSNAADMSKAFEGACFDDEMLYRLEWLDLSSVEKTAYAFAGIDFCALCDWGVHSEDWEDKEYDGGIHYIMNLTNLDGTVTDARGMFEGARFDRGGTLGIENFSVTGNTEKMLAFETADYSLDGGASAGVKLDSIALPSGSFADAALPDSYTGGWTDDACKYGSDSLSGRIFTGAQLCRCSAASGISISWFYACRAPGVVAWWADSSYAHVYMGTVDDLEAAGLPVYTGGFYVCNLDTRVFSFSDYPVWTEHAVDYTVVSNFAPASTVGYFQQALSIDGIEHLDMSKVTDISGMFCLAQLNENTVSAMQALRAENIQYAQEAFSGLTSDGGIYTLDLSGIKGSLADGRSLVQKNMEEPLALSYLDLSGFTAAGDMENALDFDLTSLRTLVLGDGEWADAGLLSPDKTENFTGCWTDGVRSLTGDQICELSDASGIWVWEEAPDGCTLLFDKNADDAAGAMPPLDCPAGEAVSLPECAFTRTGWVFAGWSLSADAAEGISLPGALVTDPAGAGESLTYYAQWTPAGSLLPETGAQSLSAVLFSGVLFSAGALLMQKKT